MRPSIERARARRRPEVSTARAKVWTRVCAALLAMSAAACSPGRDIHDAFNSRETGPYIPASRTLSPDGTLVVHVIAHRPEHAKAIAEHIVRQNYAASPPSLRVIVDPAQAGARQVFLWDAHGLRADASTEGLPPVPEPGRQGGDGSH